MFKSIVKKIKIFLNWTRENNGECEYCSNYCSNQEINECRWEYLNKEREA